MIHQHLDANLGQEVREQPGQPSAYTVGWLPNDERFRCPPIVVDPVPYIHPEVRMKLGITDDDQITGHPLYRLQERVFSEFAGEFDRLGGKIMRLGPDDRQLPTSFVQSSIPILLPDGSQAYPEPVFAKAVWLGDIDQAIARALDCDEIEEFITVLRDLLPEIEVSRSQGSYPLIAAMANRFNMSHLPPNYMNVVMIKDNSGLIRYMRDDRKKEFMRVIMLKYGSFRNKVVLYQESESGDLSYEYGIFSTLEGGIPILPIPETARRVMLISSVFPVGGGIMDESGLHIPQEEWADSHAVLMFRELAKVFDTYGLFEAPVEIRSRLKYRSTSAFIQALLNYGRQSAGAMWLMMHSDRFPQLGDFYGKGFPIVSASGRFNTTKPDPQWNHIIPGYPTRDGKFCTIPVWPAGMSLEDARKAMLGVSVEAEEATTYLDRFPWGTFTGGFHLHGDMWADEHPAVINLPYDFYRKFPYPCASSGMHAEMYEYMQEAYDIKRRYKPQAELGLARVGNHGYNGLFMGIPNERTVMLIDYLFREGYLHFTRHVKQF